jgi:hypothetical protein
MSVLSVVLNVIERVDATSGAARNEVEVRCER